MKKLFFAILGLLLIAPFAYAQVSGGVVNNLFQVSGNVIRPVNSSWVYGGTVEGIGGIDINWTWFNGSGIQVGTTTNQVLIGGTATTSLAALEVQYLTAAKGSILAIGSTTLQALTRTSELALSSTTLQNFTGQNSSTTGTEWNSANFFHFGSAVSSNVCNSSGGTCLELVGSDNTVGGVNLQVQNTNSGTSAYTGVNISNSSLSSNTANFAGIFINSPNYTDTTFGSGVNMPNQFLVQNTISNLSLVTSSTTSSNSYINFLTGGSNAPNERMRITSTGLVGIGTTSPVAVLTVVNGINTIGNTPLFSIASTTAGTATSTLFQVSANGQVSASTTMPVLTACGTSPSVRGDDQRFTITVGSVAATGCTATFGTVLPQTPHCNISSQTSLAASLSYTESKTAVVISNVGSIVGDLIDVQCSISNNG